MISGISPVSSCWRLRYSRATLAAARTWSTQAWWATSQITAANGKRIQDAIKLRNQLAGKYSSELFSSFVLQRKGLEVQQLFEWFEQIWEQTEPAYQGLLLRMRRGGRCDRAEARQLDH